MAKHLSTCCDGNIEVRRLNNCAWVYTIPYNLSVDMLKSHLSPRSTSSNGILKGWLLPQAVAVVSIRGVLIPVCRHAVTLPAIVSPTCLPIWAAVIEPLGRSVRACGRLWAAYSSSASSVFVFEGWLLPHAVD
jgi:hypothetical protein